MAGGLRVGVAFDDPTLEPTPTWTYLTDEESLVAGAQIDRGRQFELDRTDTGTAIVRINDRRGLLDPTYSLGPYYGKIEPLLQIILDLWDPVAAAYSTIYRGFIEEFNYQVDPSQLVSFLEINCVDLFAILSAIEMQPQAFGDPAPAGAEGQIAFNPNQVDDRFEQVLGNAGIPSALITIFTGNVNMPLSIYSPGDTIMQVLDEANDAEFPGVANRYISRDGKYTFHGRKARFDPVTVAAGAGGAWPFTHWKAGDGAKVATAPTEIAHIRSLAWNRGLSKIFNSASASPQGISDEDIAGQLVQDPTSIALRGFRSWSADNLQNDGGKDDSLDANDECKLFATYIVDNYAQPRNRITELTFRPMHPSDERAAANWALICGAEISDLIDVTASFAWGGGFNEEPFFIEGVHYDIKPMTGEFADVTLSLDVSPQAYFNSDPFS